MYVKFLFSILISFSFFQARVCEVTKLNGCCCEVSRNLNDKPQDEFVAFTALTTNKNALTNDPIKYDNIVTNIGKAYSSTSGIFRAPITGIYSISFSLMGYHTDAIYANLYHNGKEIIRLYTRGGNRHEVTSHTVFLKLVKGDEVWVQGTAGKKLWASEPYNQFSGALIRSGDFAS
ncbi:complement C1q tumor necrosis factor-related protein 3-like [Mytilus trossulus]|uniref:complement C1q tumor necrosis factor-related protein 3-like n=1 Tax=Mytilus trossulus TaxID=6551 RepID=UPI0030076BBC